MANTVQPVRPKSSAEQIAEAERGARLARLKAESDLCRELQLHLTTHKRRIFTQMSDERYAAAGYIGNPRDNLINAAQRLRDFQDNNGDTIVTNQDGPPTSNGNLQ